MFRKKKGLKVEKTYQQVVDEIVAYYNEQKMMDCLDLVKEGKYMDCEKCWEEAYVKSVTTGKPQSECYQDLLVEREDNPCSAEEQAGQWWDEKTKTDKRKK